MVNMMDAQCSCHEYFTQKSQEIERQNIMTQVNLL